jgi:hypothetical protein
LTCVLAESWPNRPRATRDLPRMFLARPRAARPIGSRAWRRRREHMNSRLVSRSVAVGVHDAKPPIKAR